MNKGLEALKRLKWGLDITQEERIGLCECVEQELKALEILRTKRVQLDTLFSIFANHNNKEKSVQLTIYNCCVGFPERKLTQEEYDLLKEVLL